MFQMMKTCTGSDFCFIERDNYWSGVFLEVVQFFKVGNAVDVFKALYKLLPRGRRVTSPRVTHAS
jgi:hypothetical protein